MVSCGESNSTNSSDKESKAGSPAADILAKVKEAVAKKDIEMLVALGHWEGVPEKYPNIIRENMTDIFDYKDPKYTVVKMTEKEKADSKAGDRTFSWNIPAYGWIIIDSEKQQTKIPIGMKDGKYYLISKVEK